MRVAWLCAGAWVMGVGCAETTRGVNADGAARDATNELATPLADAAMDALALPDASGSDTFAVDLPEDLSVAVADAGQSPNVPRPVAPLSTATVTSQRPTLHWSLPPGFDGAYVEVCHDRACSMVEQSIAAPGDHASVLAALVPGVHYWRLTTRAGGASAADWSPTWEFWVGHRSAPKDASWGTTADFNGDGLPDVVVGASDGAYVYFGVAGGVSTMPTILALPAGAREFGSAVASAGDVNGDGYADLVVGDVGAAMAYVYDGGSGGLSYAPTALMGTDPTSGFGGSVAGAGDVNGDGYADVLVGVENYSNGYVYLGSADGPVSPPIVLTNGDVNFGTSFVVAPAGDVNGDGYADIVAAAWFSAEAYLFIGTPSGTSTMPFPLAEPTEHHGFGVAIAGDEDVNGDGYADIVATTSSGVWVYAGGIEGPAMMPVEFSSDVDLAQAGSPVTGAGDVNGDGYGDYIVGDSTAGTATIFFGGTAGVSASVVVSGTASARFGIAVGAAGDLNGDGLDDVIAGSDAAAYLYFGRASGTAWSPFATLMRPADEGFGGAVAALSPRLRPRRERLRACESPRGPHVVCAPRRPVRRSG